MSKLILILLAVILAVPTAFAAFPGEVDLLEAGVFVAGNFLAISDIPGIADGSVYLLGRDHRVVELSADGGQQSLPLPSLEGAGEDDYFCDMVADERGLSFCGYAFSGVYFLDFNELEKLNFIKVRVADQPVNVMMIARKGEGWCIKDADERVLHVALDGSVRQLPQHASIESDKYGTSVIIPPPRDQGDKIVYPGNVLREDGQPLWIAPSPESPREIMAIEYLGNDSTQRDIFLVTTASGELDAENTLYAVKHSKVVAKRVVVQPSVMGVMRYCRLSADDSILIITSDPNGRDGVLVKRLSLETTQASEG